MGQTWIPRLALGLALGACGATGVAAPAPDLAWGSDRHFERLQVAEAQWSQPAPGQYLSPVLQAEQPFDRLLASWNVRAPEGASFELELRVGDAQGWSPWLWLADWGPGSAGPQGRTQSCPQGAVDVDLFQAEDPQRRAQLRLSGLGVAGEPVALSCTRLDLCLRAAERQAIPPPRPRPAASPPLELPSFSQFEASAELGPRICSPTSLAMVLGFHGQPVTPVEVAGRAYDPWHDLYGNWPRAIQTAWSYGVPGYLTCFSSWGPLEKLIRAGKPVIISISVAPGALAGAPYGETPGHLLVVVGFDGQGGVLVHDPASRSRDAVRRVYDQAELGRAWFGHGGVAYVLASAQKPG